MRFNSDCLDCCWWCSLKARFCTRGKKQYNGVSVFSLAFTRVTGIQQYWLLFVWAIAMNYSPQARTAKAVTIKTNGDKNNGKEN